MAEGFVFTSATDANDLLNQIVSQAAVHGWTQHNLSTLGGGTNGAGRRGHFSKDGVVVNLASYTLNTSSQSAKNEMLNAIIPAADRAFADSGYNWYQGASTPTPDILCINASTSYDGSNWYRQPGSDALLEDTNKGRFATIRTKGAIGKVYMFFHDNPAAFIVVCEVRPGEFYWLTAGRLQKDYEFSGGQYYGASLPDTNTVSSYPENLDAVRVRYAEDSVVRERGNGWGGSYVTSPSRRAGSNPSASERVPGHITFLGGSSNVQLASEVQLRGYEASTGRLWVHPPFVYANRPDDTKTYTGVLPHIHFCTTENFVGADIVTIGGEEYMVFPANWRQSPWNINATTDTSQGSPWYRHNHFGSGFAIRKPS